MKRENLRGIGPLIGLGLLLLPLTARAADIHEPGPFADVPLGDPANTQFQALEQDIYGYVPMGGKREKTYYECFIELTDAVSVLTHAPRSRYASRSRLLPDAKMRLEADPQTLADLGILLRRFAPVMRIMAQKDHGDAPIDAGLAYFRPPFSDVPSGHWAAASVEALRRAGILLGSHTPDPSDGRGWQLLPPSSAGQPVPPESFNAPPGQR